MIDSLIHAARETGLQAAKLMPERQRRSYCTLQPGADMPLWDELRQRVAKRLNKRGEKVNLARFLGVSRQRLHLIIGAQKASPDAERTLLLLAWVVAREQGHDLN